MEHLQNTLNKIERYSTAVVQKRFISKKNTVGMVRFEGKTCVFKLYHPQHEESMNREIKILSKASPVVPVPSIIEKDYENHMLILDYIAGENLCDILNDSSNSIEKKHRTMELLSDWFVAFHSSFKTKNGFLIRGDSNLRNFVYNDTIWGIDFEEVRPGIPEEDIGQLCASLLTSDPLFTDEKIHLCQLFITSYERSSSTKLLDINRHIRNSLDEIHNRRNKHIEIIERYRNRIIKNEIFR